MSNVKSKASHRLLAAFISFVMVFSMVPFSMVAHAATPDHPDAVTITVVDDVTGEPIEGAKVTYVIFDNDLGEDVMGSDEIPTDANGELVVFNGSDELPNCKISSITVTHEDYATYTNDAYDQAITSLQDNFTIEMTCTKIKDVEIAGKTLTYTGEAQELVSVTEIEGDIVEYYINGAADPVTEIPTATDVGTYSVRVVVTRTGYSVLDTTVDTVINAANIEGIEIEPVAGLKYNEANQALVTLIGSFAEGDVVTWTVNGTDEATSAIPEKMAVGSYTVTLTVDRGSNYNKLEKTVNVDIALGEIDLGDLKIEANDRVYDTTEQDLLVVTNAGDYTLEYSDDNQATWNKNVIPAATDAGEYVIYVKATKEGYNDKNTPAFPITVTIAKAEQKIEFVNADIPETVVLSEKPDENIYDFIADGENLSGKDVKYSLVDASRDDVATISTDGKVTVLNAGMVTVEAIREGNDNYKDTPAIRKTIVIKISGDLIKFPEDNINYTLDEDGIVSTMVAEKAHSNDNGALTYSLKDDIGLKIDKNGKVTVDDRSKLYAEMGKDGSVIAEVSVDKAPGTVTHKKWSWEKFSYVTTTEEIYVAASATYYIKISYDEVDDIEALFKMAETDETGWYNKNYPATITPVDSSKYKIALDEPINFGDSVTIEEQGVESHYIFLKDVVTKKITVGVKVEQKVDTIAPDATKMSIEIQELSVVEKLGVKFGFYNPTVNIKFFVEDELESNESGLDHITWFYTKGGNATSSILADKTGILPVTIEDGKYVATLSITATEAEQFRGHIAFTATDKAGNESSEVKENNVVIVVDTINPTMSVDFTKADVNDVYNPVDDNGVVRHYFSGSVDFTFTVKEANFFSENIDVSVTRDGVEYDDVAEVWTPDSQDDEIHYGKFTLTEDGDYVVTVDATDESGNPMDTYTSETITIDTIAPKVSVEYIHNEDVQKTIFTVTEHNFRASDVVITGTMKDIKDADIEFTADELTDILHNATWTQDGDVYTYEYDQYVNGIYDIKIGYKDISGWGAKQAGAKFFIDHSAPNMPTIEYITDPWDTFLSVATYGYYNPSVTVRFTSYDDTTGVDSFTWDYTKEFGASTIDHPEKLEEAEVPAVQDRDDKTKFTAEITLTAEEAAQYRGYLGVLATDDFGNHSDKIVDDGNIIVVDNVNPEITVEYTKSDRAIDNNYFYNNDVEVKLTVTEANFYAEDVVVTVTKDGKDFDYGTITWGSRDKEDKTIGTFTLPAPEDHSGDGDYVITIKYTDRSNNIMDEYVSDTHTIDTTAPVINVSYDDEKVAVVNTLTDSENNNRKYYAGTKTATITIDEHNFIADEVDFTIIAKDVTGAELDADALNSKTEWTVDSTGDVHIITITYPGDANYTFDVEYTDKATNAAEDYATDYFTVDKTAPANLKIEYSTSVLDTVLESLSFGFYNAKMTVTLTAEDSTSQVNSFLYSYLNAAGVSSVNAELINEAIQAADIKYSEDNKTATVSFEIPKMVLGNDNQFNGTVEFTATDRAGNTTDVHKETKRIIVDNIAPTAQVSYNEAVNVVGDISYYDGDINATITINEANFYADDVQVMVSKDGGVATAVAPVWVDNSVDVHVGTFTLTEDGDYVVSISYKDKSSNEMATYTSNQMTIDTKIEAPTYTINDRAKTAVGGAYKGDAKIGFNFEDQNFDTNTIRLTRTRFNKVEDVTNAFVKVASNDKGGSGSFTIPAEVENDGIYVLKVSMTDKAKHVTESEIKFTINRYGSVYEYSDELADLIKNGGQYVKAVENDLVITEYNADRLLEDSLQILITRDGETVDVDFASNPANINSQVGIGESGWYQYTYTIKASNFEKDGVYKISLASKYAADDVAENDSTSVPENSINEQGEEILDTMSFTVDSVAPEIRNIINLDQKIADKDKIVDGKLNVKYTIVDVGGLNTIEVIVNGETVQSYTAEDIAENAYNFTGDFDLTEQDGTTAHKVQIKVTDLAGNVTDTDSEEFLKAHSEDEENSTYVFFNEVTVSRNFFVRWYANTGLFWGSIAGVIVLAGGICFLIAAKKKKKEESK